MVQLTILTATPRLVSMCLRVEERYQKTIEHEAAAPSLKVDAVPPTMES